MLVELKKLDKVTEMDDGSQVSRLDIEKRTSDGLALKGFLFRYTPPQGESLAKRSVMLFLHETGIYLPQRIKYFNRVSMSLRTDIVVLTYRGFWMSEGVEPTETGIMTDCNTILDNFAEYLTFGKPYDQRILYGKSFGCAAAI